MIESVGEHLVGCEFVNWPCVYSFKSSSDIMWMYTNVLNQDLQILIEISVALVSTLYGPFDFARNILTLKLLVFNVLLPCAGITNLGFISNFRDGSFWRYCGAFLMMRAIMLIAHLLWAAVRGRRYKKVYRYEHVATNWLVTCWVSSSILGPPLMESVFGKEYELLAFWSDVSSFIFQLPVVLLFFEIDAVARCWVGDRGKAMAQVDSSKGTCARLENCASEQSMEYTTNDVVWYRKRVSRGEWKMIAWNLAKAPLIWAVVAGVLLSVTTLGPRYLFPGFTYDPNCDYVEYTGFIYLFFSSLAKCLEPLALFSVGIVLSKNNPFTCGLWRIAGYMAVKLIFVPFLMVGCAFAVGLSDSEARAAVLIALLPVSPPAFALTGHYGVGLAEAVSTILVGKILVIPTILAWQGIMDSIDLFPYNAPPDVPVCTS